ncbi:MAG: hypothetical protein M3301_05345 [Chloroflexota bacterium]|nr:hypothetical protein [Chloroflexota bacterium]
MRLRLLVRVRQGSGVARWERLVERPYPGVPVAGDWVHLADDAAFAAASFPVSDVRWENDGTVALTFDFENASDEYLEALGFAKVAGSS